MPVSPLAIFRNLETAYLLSKCPDSTKSRSRKDDKNAIKSAKFALFCSVLAEVEYSSLTFSNPSKIKKYGHNFS